MNLKIIYTHKLNFIFIELIFIFSFKIRLSKYDFKKKQVALCSCIFDSVVSVGLSL